MAFNAEPNAQTLAEVLAMAPDARQDAISQYFHKASAQHNALMNFTSKFDPNSKNGGVRSIFCEKTELRAGGKARVHFNTIGLPGGPGAVNGSVLTGNESKSSIANYSVAVDWVRDAVSLTEDEIQMIEAGRNLEATLMDLLATKMGLVKQNQMLRRLIDYGYDLSTAANWTNGVDRGHVYRVGNRASIHDITADDTLSIDVSNTTRAMLNTLGASPLKKDMSKAGCPISKYLLFGSETAFLPIRNDSLFSTAKDADVRGSGNANFTGELLDWQGNPFYELPVQDHAWDDYKGGPLIAKAVLGTAFSTGSASADCKLEVDSTNTDSLYFQWFDGYVYPYNRLETGPTLTSVPYYGWVCNPDGSRAFIEYVGGHDGNVITVTKILAGNDVGADGAGSGGTSTKGYKTVGELTTGTDSTTSSNVITIGTGTTLPATGVNGSWVYTDAIQAGAVVLQANAKGVCYSRSFMFGSMAAMFAHGAVKMQRIMQNFDYDFVKGSGYQMIFGTGVALDPLGNPNGYILIEHAVDHVGYPCPSYEAP